MLLLLLLPLIDGLWLPSLNLLLCSGIGRGRGGRRRRPFCLFRGGGRFRSLFLARRFFRLLLFDDGDVGNLIFLLAVLGRKRDGNGRCFRQTDDARFGQMKVFHLEG